jgi:DNA-binding NarL/FixJ family response regulator
MSISATSVLLVDDHPMVIAGVRQTLEMADDIRVVGEALCAREAMDELAVRSIDVALVDINLPDENGLMLLQRIKRTHPHVAVVMLSTYSEEMYALRALRAGADGYLTKGAPLAEVIAAVRTAAGGGKNFSAFLSDLLVRQVQRGEVRGHAALTPREFDIMMRLVAGESTGKIAAQLNRSPKTISTHRSRLFEKLNVQSNAQLTRYAMEHGLIGPTLTSE